MTKYFIIYSIASAIGVAIALIIAHFRHNYAGTKKCLYAQIATEEYAQQIIGSDEVIIIADCSNIKKENIVLTNKNIYYSKKGAVVFQATYDEVISWRCLDPTNEIVPPYENVTTIILKFKKTTCRLYEYPRANTIALELEKRLKVKADKRGFFSL